MAANALDLAEFRLLRALRGGGGGPAFTQLWNAHAGPVWSTFRAMVDRDDVAIGWMASFRLDLQERVHTLRMDEAVSLQVGRALYAHARAGFGEGGPIPEGPLTPDEAGVRQLPAPTRLAYLVDLFFDWTPPDPDVRRVYRLLEPAADTDARLLVHTALLRNPPAEALILPPGVDPAAVAEVPPPPKRSAARAVGLAILVAVGVVAGVLLANPGDDPARLHRDATSARGGVMVADSAAELSRRLRAAGVEPALAECPILESAGLVLDGARVDGAVVVLLYHRRGAAWTLQHRGGGDLPGEPEGEGSAGEGSGVHWRSWRDGEAVWTLASHEPADVVEQLSPAVIRAEHDAAAPAEAPSAVGSPAP